MSSRIGRFAAFITLALLLAACGQQEAPVEVPAAEADEEPVLNLYSSRHYDTDERLYSEFTEATGIRINRIEDNAAALMARMRAEGANSPADIFLTTDVGRLWAAEEAGLFQSLESDLLEARIPAHLRDPNGEWFGFSQRARVIFYDRARVNADQIRTYASLADPRFEGMICTRSSSNVYMLSLMASRIAHLGEEGARTWAQGLWDNRARDPQGGDTDQLAAIASGECAIAVANTYYFARALHSDVRGLRNPEDTSRIGVVFPDQGGDGTHVNISGGGIAIHAPHPDNARRFLEYLASERAQVYFSEGNDEYPVVDGVPISDAIASLGAFQADDLDLADLGRYQRRAQEIYDEVGYR